MSSLAATAYHEAGHAVAAWRIGMTIEGIVADVGVGHIITRGPRGLYWREYLRRRLLMLYAGPEAQRWYEPASDMAADCAGDYSDAANLCVIAYGADSPLLPLVQRVAELRTRTFVRQERTVIDAVAAALICRRHLTGTAALRIMREAAAANGLAIGP